MTRAMIEELTRVLRLQHARFNRSRDYFVCACANNKP